MMPDHLEACAMTDSAQKPIIITLDGYTATGKGTIGREIARMYKFDHLDTGKFYRIVAHKVMQSDLFRTTYPDGMREPTQDIRALARTIASSLVLQDAADYPDGSDAEQALRSSAVSDVTSKLAQNDPDYRKTMTELFKRFVEQAKRGIVVDGRDGGRIFPHADVKFVLDGNAATRAKWRYKQLSSEQQQTTSIAEQQHELEVRDARDKASVYGNQPSDANDAIKIDVTKELASFDMSRQPAPGEKRPMREIITPKVTTAQLVQVIDETLMRKGRPDYTVDSENLRHDGAVNAHAISTVGLPA
jgi:cytidylate kinase